MLVVAGLPLSKSMPEGQKTPSQNTTASCMLANCLTPSRQLTCLVPVRMNRWQFTVNSYDGQLDEFIAVLTHRQDPVVYTALA